MTNMMNEGERAEIEAPLHEADDGEAKEGADLELSEALDGDDSDARLRAALEKTQQRAQQIRRNARSTFRTMEGWQRVRSEEDWVRINEEAGEEYESGQFLLERLGAQRYLEPELMATLMRLRRRIIAESGITTAAESMLVDLAVLNYYQTLRVQGWIGDLELHLEHEFFGQDAFATDKRQQQAVEDRVRRLREQLMPLLERANRMVIRNLKAIKELRQGQVPAIAIRTEHVTVTNRQNGRAPHPVTRSPGAPVPS